MGKGKNIAAGRNRGEGVVIMSTSISTQISNQKAAKKQTNKQTNKKTEISREQHSKQANIRQEKLWKITQKVRFASPVFITSGI